MTSIDTDAHGRRARIWGLAMITSLVANTAWAQTDPEWTPDPPSAERPVLRLRKDTAPRIPYHESMPVPEGYHLESTPRYGLVAAGVSMTATLWVVSTITAITLDREKSDDGDPNFDDMYWPMFIPVAGPFATIATADSSGTGAAILALDGAIQTLGLALAIAGFAAPTIELVPDYVLTVAPTASGDTGGLCVSGSF